MEEGGVRTEDGLFAVASGDFSKLSIKAASDKNLFTLDSGVPKLGSMILPLALSKYGESELSESLACSKVGIAIILFRLHEVALLLELQLLFWEFHIRTYQIICQINIIKRQSCRIYKV